MSRLGISLAGLAGLLAWAYFPTLAYLYEKWCEDPQYSHGFLVPLFSAYLIYTRLPIYQSTEWRAAPILGGSLLLLAGAMRITSGLLLFHPLDAVSLIVALAGLTALCGGWQILKPSLPALAFLIFMIPLPYEWERNVGGPLKTSATMASTYMLQTCGLPAIAEGNTILIDEVRLGVVDACSGLKMLMTFAAFSAGAVILLNRSLFEKMMVLLGIIPIAMTTNVLRITATGISHQFTHDKSTIHLLHDVYGWCMMPLGLAFLAWELHVLARLVMRNGR